jgi:hypothetical protein
MIVIEGPDAVGKSTVAELLMGLLPGWSYRHHSVPPVPSYYYYTWFLADTHPRVIVDRLHWSELAYGQTYRGASDLTPQQWRLINLCLMALDARVIVLNDDPAALEGRWNREPFAKAKIAELVGRFEALPSGWELPLVVQHFRLPDLVDMSPRDPRPTEQLLQLAASEHARANMAAHLIPPSLGLGRLATAGYIILGDVPSEPKQQGDLSPLLPFGTGPASEWLWRAIDELGVDAYAGYYTNASSFGSGTDLAQYLDRAQYLETIVCLGNRAKALVTDAFGTMPRSINVFHLLHPLFVQRFQHSEFEDWRDALGEALASWRGEVTNATPLT